MRQQRRSSALNSGLFTEHSYLADSNDYNGTQDFTCSIDPPAEEPASQVQLILDSPSRVEVFGRTL